jgi:hypothetical protein
MANEDRPSPRSMRRPTEDERDPKAEGAAANLAAAETSEESQKAMTEALRARSPFFRLLRAQQARDAQGK